MPNFLDNLDIIDSANRHIQVLLQDRETLALANTNSAKIGVLDNLNTEHKDTLVNAINDNKSSIDTNTSAINNNTNSIAALDRNLSNLHIYNVLDYGAAGDGVTDDTTAIQNTINACPTHGIVYLPYTGHSYVVSAITINKPLTFKGEYTGYEVQENISGSGTPLIQASSNGYAITTTSFGVTIDNIAIKTSGSGINLTSPNTSAPFPRYTIIRNVTIDCTTAGLDGQIGVHSNNCFMSLFERVVVYHANKAFLFERGTSCTIINCWSRDCKYGYEAAQLYYSSFINCAADGSKGYAYSMYQCVNCSLINCGAESTDGSLYSFATAQFSECEAIDCSLQLTPDNATTNAIYAASSDIVFKNCYINGVYPNGASILCDNGVRINVISSALSNKKIVIGNDTYYYDNIFFTNSRLEPLRFCIPTNVNDATPKVGQMFIDNNGIINVYVGNDLWKQIEYSV